MSTLTEKKLETHWRGIAQILSKGFLSVHHGKQVPIDIIEEVQKKFYSAFEELLEGERKRKLT